MPEIARQTNSRSFRETEDFGRALAEFFLAGEVKDRATVIFLRGDLGAGKTVLSRGFLSAFGVRRVLSPTFTLAKRYSVKLQDKTRGNVYHLDAYRLKKEHISQVGLSDMRKERGAFILVEWPENFGKAPFDAAVELRHGSSEEERSIILELRP